MRLVTDSVPFILSLSHRLFLSLFLSLSFVAFADTHVFSSCLPIENRVGDQIEFPTFTSFYSLRAGRSRVAEEKISRDFPRSRCVRSRKQSRSNCNITKPFVRSYNCCANAATTNVFTCNDVLRLIKYPKEINNVRYLKFHAPITNNKTPRCYNNF